VLADISDPLFSRHDLPTKPGRRPVHPEGRDGSGGAEAFPRDIAREQRHLSQADAKGDNQ
jgi:hypothetical protein